MMNEVDLNNTLALIEEKCGFGVAQRIEGHIEALLDVLHAVNDCAHDKKLQCPVCRSMIRDAFKRPLSNEPSTGEPA
jgi:hypothetical protein